MLLEVSIGHTNKLILDTNSTTRCNPLQRTMPGVGFLARADHCNASHFHGARQVALGPSHPQPIARSSALGSLPRRCARRGCEGNCCYAGHSYVPAQIKPHPKAAPCASRLPPFSAGRSSRFASSLATLTSDTTQHFALTIVRCPGAATGGEA